MQVNYLLAKKTFISDQSQINTQTLKPALVVTRKVSTTTTTVSKKKN